jgi:hypothetical protein
MIQRKLQGEHGLMALMIASESDITLLINGE